MPGERLDGNCALHFSNYLRCENSSSSKNGVDEMIYDQREKVTLRHTSANYHFKEFAKRICIKIVIIKYQVELNFLYLSKNLFLFLQQDKTRKGLCALPDLFSSFFVLNTEI